MKCDDHNDFARRFFISLYWNELSAKRVPSCHHVPEKGCGFILCVAHTHDYREWACVERNAGVTTSSSSIGFQLIVVNFWKHIRHIDIRDSHPSSLCSVFHVDFTPSSSSSFAACDCLQNVAFSFGWNPRRGGGEAGGRIEFICWGIYLFWIFLADINISSSYGRCNGQKTSNIYPWRMAKIELTFYILCISFPYPPSNERQHGGGGGTKPQMTLNPIWNLWPGERR